MLNIEKYKEDIIKYGYTGTYLKVNGTTGVGAAIALGSRTLVNWLCEEYQEPLLTDEEKEYLCDLKKWYDFDAITVNYVYVNLLREVNDATAGVVASVTLPSTLHSVPFTHLDCGKLYSLEELEL